MEDKITVIGIVIFFLLLPVYISYKKEGLGCGLFVFLLMLIVAYGLIFGNGLAAIVFYLQIFLLIMVFVVNKDEW